MDAERTPVIVGVGQINDRPSDPDQGLDTLGLMEASLRRADEDAGGGWLADLDGISTVDQITYLGLTGIPEKLAAAFGACVQDDSAVCTRGGQALVPKNDEGKTRNEKEK